MENAYADQIIKEIYLSKTSIKLNDTVDFPILEHWKIYIEFEETDDIVYFFKKIINNTNLLIF